MKQSLKEYLDRHVPAYWEKNKKPFLLSVIGSEFKKEEIRAETGGVSVAQWIKDNPEIGYHIVSDPNNRARIGMIPNDQSFTYSSKKTENDVINKVTSESDREITLKFLELLKQRCTIKELQEINIPISILMKIL